MQVAVRVERVEQRLHGDQGHRADEVEHRRTELLDRPDHLQAPADLAAPPDEDPDDLPAPELLRDGLQRWRELEDGVGTEFLRRGGDEVAQERQHLAGLLDRVRDEAGDHDRTDAVQPVPEGRHHAEVAPTATQRPQQILVGGDEVAVGGDQARADEVVAGQAVLALQHAHAAVEGQAGDAGLGHLPGRYGQAVELGLVVDVGERRAALHPGRLVGRIDVYAAHARQVDDDPAVARAVPGDAVAPTAYRDRQPGGACVADGGDHVGGAQAARDERGAAVDESVVDAPGPLVRVVLGGDDLTPEAVDGHGARASSTSGRWDRNFSSSASVSSVSVSVPAR